MSVRFNSLFDIYPDTLREGAVVGYTKADGTALEFPCTLDTGDAVRDAKGRWTASGLGIKPVIAKYSGALKRTKAVEAWIGGGFGMNPVATNLIENATLEHVRFIDGVTAIGYFAFSDCIGLTGIKIPEGVASIGGYAFEGCTNLTSITIPESVMYIEDSAFSRCKGLAEVIYGGTIKQWHAIGHDPGSAIDVKCSDGKALFRLHKSISGSKVNVSVEGLTPYGKANCTEITIPEGVTSIGGYAFEGCTGLVGVTIPDDVTEIEGHAFYGCSGLTGINIPDSVTAIGHQTFQFCSGLTSITIPASVTYIGHHVFSGCSGLTDIYVKQPESDLLDNVKLPEGCTVHWKQAESV